MNKHIKKHSGKYKIILLIFVLLITVTVPTKQAKAYDFWDAVSTLGFLNPITAPLAVVYKATKAVTNITQNNAQKNNQNASQNPGGNVSGNSGSSNTIIGEIIWPKRTNAFNDVPSLARTLLTWILGFAGAFAVMAVVFSGFMYVTSGGDATQAEKAKKNLTWAIIGIVLVAFSEAIVWFINDVLNNAPH